MTTSPQQSLWRKRLWITSLLSVALTAVYFLWLNPNGTTDNEAQAQLRESCRFEVDDELFYQLNFTSAFQLDKRGLPLARLSTALAQPSKVSMNIALRAQRRTAKWTELSLRVGEVRVDRGAGKVDGSKHPLGLRALVRIDERCRVLGVGHKKGAHQGELALIRSLVRGLGFELSGQRRYERIEEDPSGRLKVRYGRQNSEMLIRRPLKYLATDAPSRVHIVSGVTKIDLGSGPWFKTFDSNLRLRWTERGKAIASARYTLHVERVVSLPKMGLVAQELSDDEGLIWKDPVAEPETTPKTWPGLKGMSPAAAGAEIMRLQGRADAPSQEAIDFIKAWIAANSGGARALIDALATGAIPKAARVVLVSTLIDIDGPIGRSALLYMHTLERLDAPSRAIAAMGLGQLDKSSMEVVESLAAAARRKPGTDVGLYNNASTLALGTLANKQKVSNPTLAQAAESVIHERLKQPEVEVQREALMAVSNTSADHFLDEVIPYTKHDTPSLRAAAASALRTNKDTPGLYGVWLKTEADREVLHAIGSAVRARVAAGQSLDSATQLGLSNAIGKTSELHVKSQLIGALGAAAKTDTGAKAALVAAFQRESSGRAKALYGVYLTANELMPDKP